MSGRRALATRRNRDRVARLEAQIAELRAARFPAIAIVELFANDDPIAARSYVAELEALFPQDSAIVLLSRDSPRPAGLKAPWAPPRAWLDYAPSVTERRNPRPDRWPDDPPVPRRDWTPPA